MLKKVHFFTNGAKRMYKLFEQIEADGHSRGQIFDDFLDISICSLSGGRMEDEFLKIKSKYNENAFKIFQECFGMLVSSMEIEQCDIIGDLYQGAITYGQNGQFFTPENVCFMISRMVGNFDREYMFDPACGSGRMLLAAAKVNPDRIFVGQDIDFRCVKMTAINLALNGLNGYVIRGNSLSNDYDLVYRIGLKNSGFISKIKPELFKMPKLGYENESDGKIVDSPKKLKMDDFLVKAE
ncbi:N-6 DNA methylase [Methanococcus maripaludis]|uniref:site-specific DNA-methyltransferase (adenine-specific) n=1 Tax=Methanococcus maripaludis TaxID=39152 RepID=A0A7J9SDM6_METMI|nr:N-6 DNA methylase [Methanococcus maripaludis]MBB6497785.1 type I restriction-modification system DNA methylase subunit [Methanococcus maripaludis]